MNTTTQTSGAVQSALVNTYATYPFTLDHAAGEHVFDTTGRRYIDFYGGHCVCLTGHCHPHVVQAVQHQLERLLFYSNAAPLDIREQAAARLLEFTAAGMAGVFFCNSGSEANENALKTAVLATGRKRFVAFDGAFHGRTALALSVTDAPKLTEPYTGLLAPVDRLPFNDTAALEQADFSEAAAVIVEPVQSMAGVRVAEEKWLKQLRAKCTAEGALLIFDEVQTGCGRLGTPGATQYFGVTADMITMAKGLASGYPLGALLASKAVAAVLKPGDMGSTFGGGPAACAALLATLDVIAQEGLVERTADCGERIMHAAPGGVISAVHGAGLLLGLEAGPAAAALKQHLLSSGLLAGGSNNPAVVRLLPPLTISDEAIDALLAAINNFPKQVDCGNEACHATMEDKS